MLVNFLESSINYMRTRCWSSQNTSYTLFVYEFWFDPMARFIGTSLVELAIKKDIYWRCFFGNRINGPWKSHFLLICPNANLEHFLKSVRSSDSGTPSSLPWSVGFPHHSILCFVIYLRFWIVGWTRGSSTVTSSELGVWCLAIALFALVSGRIKQTS